MNSDSRPVLKRFSQLRSQHFSAVPYILSGLLGAGALHSLKKRAPLPLAACVGGMVALLRGASKGTDGPDSSEPITLKRTFHVGKPKAEVYSFWRRFSNLAPLIKHLIEVEELDAKRSRWKASLAGMRVEWISLIVEDVATDRIAWRSEPGSFIDHEGTVRFLSVPDGTSVTLDLTYQPVAGALGEALLKALGEDPETIIEEEIKRLEHGLEREINSMDRGSPSPFHH